MIDRSSTHERRWLHAAFIATERLRWYRMLLLMAIAMVMLLLGRMLIRMEPIESLTGWLIFSCIAAVFVGVVLEPWFARKAGWE